MEETTASLRRRGRAAPLALPPSTCVSPSRRSAAVSPSSRKADAQLFERSPRREAHRHRAGLSARGGRPAEQRRAGAPARLRPHAWTRRRAAGQRQRRRHDRQPQSGSEDLSSSLSRRLPGLRIRGRQRAGAGRAGDQPHRRRGLLPPAHVALHFPPRAHRHRPRSPARDPARQSPPRRDRYHRPRGTRTGALGDVRPRGRSADLRLHHQPLPAGRLHPPGGPRDRPHAGPAGARRGGDRGKSRPFRLGQHALSPSPMSRSSPRTTCSSPASGAATATTASCRISSISSVFMRYRRTVRIARPCLNSQPTSVSCGSTCPCRRASTRPRAPVSAPSSSTPPTTRMPGPSAGGAATPA